MSGGELPQRKRAAVLKEFDNWLFLESILTGQAKFRKGMDRSDYRFRFLKNSKSQANFAEVKKHMGDIMKKVRSNKKVTYGVIDRLTDNVVAFGLELFLANDEQLLQFLLWVVEQVPLLSKTFDSSDLLNAKNRCKMRPLSLIYCLCHMILVATGYGRRKDGHTLVNLVSKLQIIINNLSAPWFHVTQSDEYIKCNIEIVLEICWIYLLANRIFGENLTFDDQMIALVEKSLACAATVKAYFVEPVDLENFGDVAMMGHAILLASFCLKERDACKFPKKHIPQVPEPLGTSAVMDVVDLESSDEDEADNTNSQPLIANTITLRSSKGVLQSPLKSPPKKKRKRTEKGLHKQEKKKKDDSAKDSKQDGGDPPPPATNQTDHKNPADSLKMPPPAPVTSQGPAPVTSQGPAPVTPQGPAPVTSSGPAPVSSGAPQNRVCCTCLDEQCDAQKCTCYLYGEKACENCVPSDFVCKNPAGSHLPLVEKRRNLLQSTPGFVSSTPETQVTQAVAALQTNVLLLLERDKARDAEIQAAKQQKKQKLEEKKHKAEAKNQLKELLLEIQKESKPSPVPQGIPGTQLMGDPSLWMSAQQKPQGQVSGTVAPPYFQQPSW